MYIKYSKYIGFILSFLESVICAIKPTNQKNNNTNIIINTLWSWFFFFTVHKEIIIKQVNRSGINNKIKVEALAEIILSIKITFS